MGKVVAEFSMSLDGFIAGPTGGDDGLHDWVFKGDVPVSAGGMTFHLASEESARIFEESIQNAGAFVLGKRAFEAANENPTFQKPSFVLSGEARGEVSKEETKITFVTDGIESALEQARSAAGEKDVYVFGGANTAQQYLEAELIDEIHIALIPVLLGDGIRLFDHLSSEQIALEKTGVIDAPRVTHLKFRVAKEKDIVSERPTPDERSD